MNPDPAPRPNYGFQIAYDGTAYAGWQRQAGEDTVQERIEQCLQTIFGEAITLHGAGRTDAGVHALAMIANAVLPRHMPPERLQAALNANLPRDIAVRAVAEVAPGFHARFSACGKRYAYRLVVGPHRPVLARDHCWWVRWPLDLPRMRDAARRLVGRHDFKAFATNPGYERRHGTVRTVQHLHLVRRSHGLDLFIQGDGFLYNMVRTITGTLLDVGRGRLSPDDVAAILASADRRRASATAPARGLCLLRVSYPTGTLPRALARSLPHPFAT